jgi:hypothetical protein
MKKIIVVLIALNFLFSCKKENNKNNTICFSGKIIWAGDPAADGLAWIIQDEVNNITFKILEPDTNFRQDGLTVNVCLTKTTEIFSCRCPAPIAVYKIESISR